MMKNIVLVGFMGTGKTAVAKSLARDTGKKYVSIDDLIEKREKRPINDIFRDDGEPYFRKVEKEIILEVSRGVSQVIDAGGGAVLDSGNIDNLKSNGMIICLWADPGTIYERTHGHAHRPLLNCDDPERKIRELLDIRRPFYAKADFHIDTTDLDINGVVKKIKNIISGEDRGK
ncbi:MAG: shikimate kinase [Candidatus Omnitrophota bacterium]